MLEASLALLSGAFDFSEAKLTSLSASVALAPSGAFALASWEKWGLALWRAKIVSQLETEVASLEARRRDSSLSSHKAKLVFLVVQLVLAKALLGSRTEPF